MEANSITRLFEIPERQQSKFNRKDALSKKLSDGSWEIFSSDDFVDYVNQISSGLLQRGFQQGDKVASISYNMPEWNFVDLGAMQCGLVHVPLYPTLGEKDIAYILKDSDATAVFVQNETVAERVWAIKDQLPRLQSIFTFDETSDERFVHWQQVLDKELTHRERVREIRNEVQQGDMATLIYTSGTTGAPKGVMLSHHNLMSNVKACTKVMPVDHRHHVLSFLPLSHVFERMVTYLYMFQGVGIYYAESIDTIADNLREVKPHFFTTVPRVLEKVYEKIYKRGLQLKGIQRSLFFWALNLGANYEHTGKGLLYRLQLALANKLIFSKWREALGNNVLGVVSGGAPLQQRLAKVFWAANIPVVEGYGLTETSPVIAVNRFDPNYCKFGTVGQPIDNVEVQIADDGEILTRGPHVMMGYYNKPEKTSEAIDQQGFYHTGDIGELDKDNYLSITDRKKEMFKTSGGKYIAPQILENKFRESPFIEQVMVIGENQKFPSALIVPNEEHLRNWARLKGYASENDNLKSLVEKQEVKDRIHRVVDKVNREFSKYERVKRFALIPNEWTIDAGDLTHTQKLKRKVIQDKYKTYWEPLYEDE